MVRKILIGLGSLLALFVILAVAIPLFVDVDHYRPQIIEAADQHLNGKLELGHLKLSLWGQVRIEVAGLELKDAKGRSIVSVQDVYFHLPLLSLISGSPEITLKMQKPMLTIVKDAAGKLNVMSLAKNSGTTPNPAASGSPAAKTGAGAPVELPGMAARARLGLEITDAQLKYQDEKTKLSSDINNLNLILKDLSLSHPTTIELWADIDTRMGKTLVVKGPIKASGRTEVTMNGSQVGKYTIELEAKADELEILQPGLFHKKPGMATNLVLSATGTAREFKIEKLNLNFFNAKVESSGVVSQLDTATSRVQYTLHSNTIDLKPWNELVPMLSEYELAGSLNLDARADGPMDKLDYSADLLVKSMTMKAGDLKAQPTFDVALRVKTDRLDSFTFTMKAPANDLKISGKVVSFEHPRLDALVTSTGMNLDQLINFPPPGKKAAPAANQEAAKEAKAGAPATGPAASSDMDALLDPLRENPMMAGMSGLISVNLASVQAYGVKMVPIVGKFTLKDLTAALEGFSMGVFGGTVKASMMIAMKPKTPTYTFNASVTGLDLQQAVSSQFELFKHTLLGKANFSMDGHGASFNPDPAKKNLNAKGNLKVTDATFATIDIGKMVSEGVNSSLAKIGDKIPGMKGKTLPAAPAKDSRYEFISSDFTIAGGKFSAPNFLTKTYPNQGIDLKGSTTVNIVDYALDTHWEVIDTYNQTKAKDISVNIAGSDVPHVLAEGAGPVRFPVSAGCNAMAPCFNYTEVPTFLAGIALKNVEGAAVGRAKSEVQKKAVDAVKSNPAVQNALKGLFGH